MNQRPVYHAGIVEFVGSLDAANVALTAAGLDRIVLEPTTKQVAPELVSCWVLVEGEGDPSRASHWRELVTQALVREVGALSWTLVA